MRFQHLLFLLAALILLPACSPPGAAAGGAAGETARETGEVPAISSAATEVSSGAATAAATSPPAAGLADCPVTQPPQPAFTPPAPWPEHPPGEDQFWYGQPGLWTALPTSGSWGQLALGEKFWWWSQEFDVQEDSTPGLAITARRLDGEAPEFRASEATNGYHASFNWAMLHGVTLPSPGCWEFTGAYKGNTLTFVLWVPLTY